MGSSSNKMSGPFTIACTIARRFCHPPDNAVASTSRVVEAGAAQSFGEASAAFGLSDTTTLHGSFDDGANRVSGRERRVLFDVAEANVFAEGQVAAVGVYGSAENFKQG